jgi:hypothetical protein
LAGAPRRVCTVCGLILIMEKEDAHYVTEDKIRFDFFVYF